MMITNKLYIVNNLNHMSNLIRFFCINILIKIFLRHITNLIV
jgi:hypothetical protein